MSRINELMDIVNGHIAELDELSLAVWKNPESGFNGYDACKLQVELRFLCRI